MSHFVPWGAPYTGWAILLVLALLGFWMAYRGLRRRSIPGGRRCPKCRYDLSHSPTATCSECGHTLRSEREATLQPRRWWPAAAGLVIALGLPAFVIQFRVRQAGWDYYTRLHPFYFFSPDDVYCSSKSGPYTVRCYQDRRRWFSGSRFDDARADILRDGKVIWRVEGRHVMPGIETGTSGSLLPVLFDIDRDGVPEFLCSTSPGGNGGYFLSHIIRLGVELQDMNPHGPDQVDDAAKYFQDLDGDGIPEAIGDDKSFQFFNVSHAGSPYPRVISRFRNHRLELAPDLMRKFGRDLTDQELADEKQRCRDAGPPGRGQYDDFFSPLLSVMLDLIYSGRTPEAFAFLDEVWPGESREKLEFLREFDERLRKSPYRVALLELGYDLPEPWKAVLVSAAPPNDHALQPRR